MGYTYRPRRGLTLASALGIVAVMAAACSSAAPTSGPSTTASSSGRSSGTATTPGASVNSLPTTSTSAAGATGAGSSPTGSTITIASPTQGATVASPLVVTGTTTLTSIQIELIDGAGNVLANVPVAVSGGHFSATMRWAAPPQVGTLTAFRTGPGGVHQDITELSVRLSD